MSTLGNFNVGAGEVTGSPPAEDWHFRRVSNWELSFCIIPRKCFLSGKRLWMTKCYKGFHMITGPGDPIFLEYYVDREKFIFWTLTK